jgi:hypothetical protein
MYAVIIPDSPNHFHIYSFHRSEDAAAASAAKYAASVRRAGGYSQARVVAILPEDRAAARRERRICSSAIDDSAGLGARVTSEGEWFLRDPDGGDWWPRSSCASEEDVRAAYNRSVSNGEWSC